MKYASGDQGIHSDDDTLRAIESEEGLGLPGQSAVGTVANISTQDENSTDVTAPTGVRKIDLTKEPGIVSNEGLSSVAPGSLSPLINGALGSNMNARIAYIMENGEPFCNHCEKNFVPSNLTRIACTNCGCGQPNDDHSQGEHLFAGEDLPTSHHTASRMDLEHVEGPTVADEAPNDLIKQDHTASKFLAMFDKVSNDSELYYRGYSDAHAGEELDEDLAILSDDYFHGYDQYKFYNKTPQESVGQSLYDMKPNSNAIPRDEKMKPEEFDRGPAELTDGVGTVTASRALFPVDVMTKFFEV